MSTSPDSFFPTLAQALRVLAPGDVPASNAARAFNLQLARIDKLKTQLDDLDTLGQTHRVELHRWVAPLQQRQRQRMRDMALWLAECLQGFERFSGESVRRSGLTHAQFDIIATLGNTPGMSYKELGDKTLITKGTLTGVIERLEQKGWVARVVSERDRRARELSLTPEGERTFQALVPVVRQLQDEILQSLGDADRTRFLKLARQAVGQ